MPRTGLEPVQPYDRGILSPLCLPIPPPGHMSLAEGQHSKRRALRQSRERMFRMGRPIHPRAVFPPEYPASLRAPSSASPLAALARLSSLSRPSARPIHFSVAAASTCFFRAAGSVASPHLYPRRRGRVHLCASAPGRATCFPSAALLRFAVTQPYGLSKYITAST